MDEISYAPRPAGRVGPLLAIICAAVFLATALVGVIEAIVLFQEAETFAESPVCTPSESVSGCRLQLEGTVVGGYDEVSGLAPGRHIDVMATDGVVLHLTSPLVGQPEQVGALIGLEYWKGKVVRFATSAGTFETPSYPAGLARASRLLAWFAFGLSLLSAIIFVAAFRRGRPLPTVPEASEFSIGVSRWFFIGVGVLIFFLGFSVLASYTFSGRSLTNGVKSSGLPLLALSGVILSAIGRRVTFGLEGLLYLRRFVTFSSIARVGLEPGRLPFSGNTIVRIHPTNGGKALAINTRYFGWQNRVLLLKAIASRSTAAEFDASSKAFMEGNAVEWQEPVSSTDPWQSQNRGCATSLVGVGSALIILGLFLETLGGPQIGGLWAFLIGAILVGLGIHRNIYALRGYFGRPRGDFLSVLQSLMPIVAWGIDMAGEFLATGTTRVLIRLLSLLPFVAIWLLVWLPLSKAHESMDDQMRVA